MKRFLFLLLVLFVGIAHSQTVTPTYLPLTQGLRVNYVGKTPSGADSLMYPRWFRQYFLSKSDSLYYVTRSYFALNALKRGDTTSLVATRYWVEHMPHTYYGGITYYGGALYLGTGGNSIAIDGNSVGNPNTSAATSYGANVKFISPGVFQFSNNSGVETIRFPNDGNIIDWTTGKHFLKQGDAPTVGSTYTKTQVDSAANRKQDTSKTEHFVGQIFTRSSFNNLTGFTDVSSGATASSGVLNFATGSGDNTFVKQLQVTYTTALKKYREIARFVVGEKTATSYGFALGTQSTYSGPGKINIAGKFDMTNTASSGQVSIVGGDITNLYPTLVTGSTSLTFSVGDTVEMVMERYMNKFTVSARNVSTSSAYVSATTTMTYNGSAGVYQPNMGQFAIYNLGGAFKVSTITINSREIRNPKLMLFTDSKGEFGTRFLTTNVATYLTIMNNSTVLLSGRGNTTTDMLALLPEVYKINPETADLSYSSNDIRGGSLPATYQPIYKQAVDSLTAHGIKVIHTLPLYEPGLDQTSMTSYIKTNYPNTYVNVPIVSSDLVDGTHLNEAGMLKWYNSTSDAVKVQQGAKNEALKFILDQSNTLLTGLVGSQTVVGGFNASESLTFTSTASATKGKLIFGPFGTNVFDETNRWWGFGTSVPTHTLTIASVSSGLAHYNTTDQITNLERGTLAWSSNAYGILVANAGTGTQRDAFIRLNSGRQFNVHASPSAAGTFEFAAGTSGTGPVAEVTGSYTAATGRQWGYTVGNTINQSGTAGFTSFASYPLVSASGSGGNFIFQGGTSTAAALGGALTTNYSVDNSGNVIQAGSLTQSAANSYSTGGYSLLGRNSTSGRYETIPYGTANQVQGINAAGTAVEYKTVIGDSNTGQNVTQNVGSIAISNDTTKLRTVANSYSLASMQTKLNGYAPLHTQLNSQTTTTQTLTYNLDIDYTGSANATYTLPAVSATLKGFSNGINIYNLTAFTITINAASGSTIWKNGAVSSVTLGANSACTFYSNGTYNLYR